MVCAGVRQAGVIACLHSRDLKFGYAALDGHGAVVGKFKLYLTGRHPVNDVAELLGIQHSLTGNQHIALDGGSDTDLHIVAGQRELKTFGFQQNAF